MQWSLILTEYDFLAILVVVLIVNNVWACGIYRPVNCPDVKSAKRRVKKWIKAMKFRMN